MIIAFDTLELRSICEDEKAAIARLGADYIQLRAGLADILSAAVLSDLPAGVLEPESPVSLRMDCGKHAVFFIVSHQILPLDGDGALIAEKVRRLRVVEVRP